MFLNSILISLKLCKQLPPPTAITTTTTTAIENTFYHLFQKELFAVILKQINLFPSKITKQSLRFFGKIALDIALTNKSFYHCLKTLLLICQKCILCIPNIQTLTANMKVLIKMMNTTSYTHLFSLTH